MFTSFISNAKFAIFYRIVVAFVLGYLCSIWFNLIATSLLSLVLPKAESIFLAALLTIIPTIIWVLYAFIIKHLAYLSAIYFFISLSLFVICKMLQLI